MLDPEFHSVVATDFDSFLDLCFHFASQSTPNAEYFFSMLWFTWLERNNSIFQNGPTLSLRIPRQAGIFLDEFTRASSIDSLSNCRGLPPNQWIKPKDGVLKVNVDAGVRLDHGTAGIVMRNQDGALISAIYVDLGVVASVEFAELSAILLGMKEAARIWSGEVVFESDSSLCIARLHSDEDDLTTMGVLVSRIWKMKKLFCGCHFNLIRRNCNIPTDRLDNLGFSIPNFLSGYSNWGTQPPQIVLSALLADF